MKTLWMEVDADEANSSGDPSIFRLKKMAELVACKKLLRKRFFHSDFGLHETNSGIKFYEDKLDFPKTHKEYLKLRNDKRMAMSVLRCLKNKGVQFICRWEKGVKTY